ncbi:MAG: CRISPR-associated endoribonuclease Cas6 [bacterium JZ-2024 1]
MPVATFLFLHLKDRKDLFPKQFHNIVLLTLSRSSKQVASALHKTAPFKAYTICQPPSRRKFPPDTRVLRVSFFQDEILPHFIRGAMDNPHPLPSTPFTPTSVAIGGSPWSQRKSFSQIYEDANPEHAFTLQFATPTTFRQGDLDLPLPVPKLIFQGLLTRWNAFSGIPFPEDLVEVFERFVAIQEHSLKTLPFNDGRVIIPGFVGKVTFKIIGKLPSETLHQINCLADFAFYAGVGRKTTHGMGLTRKIR